jgi:hypothetical protein
LFAIIDGCVSPGHSNDRVAQVFYLFGVIWELGLDEFRSFPEIDYGSVARGYDVMLVSAAA